MKKLLSVIVLAVLSIGVAVSQTEIPNGDFEEGTGSLESWELTSGDAQVRSFLLLNSQTGQVTIDPQSGDRMLTTGS